MATIHASASVTSAISLCLMGNHRSVTAVIRGPFIATIIIMMRIAMTMTTIKCSPYIIVYMIKESHGALHRQDETNKQITIGKLILNR